MMGRNGGIFDRPEVRSMSEKKRSWGGVACSWNREDAPEKDEVEEWGVIQEASGELKRSCGSGATAH